MLIISLEKVNCFTKNHKLFGFPRISSSTSTSTIDPFFLELFNQWASNGVNLDINYNNNYDLQVSDLHNIDSIEPLNNNKRRRNNYYVQNTNGPTAVYVGAIIHEKELKPNLLTKKATTINSPNKSQVEKSFFTPQVILTPSNSERISFTTNVLKSNIEQTKKQVTTTVTSNIENNNVKSHQWKVFHPKEKTMQSIPLKQVKEEEIEQSKILQNNKNNNFNNSNSKVKINKVPFMTSSQEKPLTTKQLVKPNSVVIVSQENEKNSRIQKYSCTLTVILTISIVLAMTLLLVSIIYLMNRIFKKWRKHKFQNKLQQRQQLQNQHQQQQSYFFQSDTRFNPRVNFQRTYQQNWLRTARQIEPQYITTNTFQNSNRLPYL